MKNFILTFIAFLMLSGNAFGQTKNVESDLREGKVSFVTSLGEYYEVGMTYMSFKTKVIGKSNLSNITKEGDALLNESFDLLKSNANTKTIYQSSFKKFGEAIILATKLDPKNHELGFIQVFGSEKYFSSNSYEVHSLDQVDCAITDLAVKCRWWQLKCHLQEIFGEDGGNTIINVIVQAIVKAVEALVN